MCAPPSSLSPHFCLFVSGVFVFETRVLALKREVEKDWALVLIEPDWQRSRHLIGKERHRPLVAFRQMHGRSRRRRNPQFFERAQHLNGDAA